LDSNLRKLNFLSKYCRLPHHTDRKLVTIAVLSAIGGAEPMLRNHFAICLNVGLSPDQLNEFVTIIRAAVGDEEAENTKRVLNEALGNELHTGEPNEKATKSQVRTLRVQSGCTVHFP
jgi:undecaprenyl pyrophosphate synthase